MKMIVAVVLALVAISVALPVEETRRYPEILRSKNEPSPEGGYVFGFETEDGISRKEKGELRETIDEEKKPHTVVVVRGTYTYTDPEGNVETVHYFADENGFHTDIDPTTGNQTPK